MFEGNPIFELSAHAWIGGLAYAGIVVAGVIAILAVGARLFLRPPDWRPRVAQLTPRAWEWRDAGVVALVLLNLQLAMLVWNAFLTGHTPLFWLVLDTLTFHVAGLGMIVLFLRTRRVSWRAAFGLDARRAVDQAGAGILFYLVMLPILLFSSVAYQIFLAAVDYPSTLQPVAEMLTAPQSLAMRLYVLLLAVVIAPVAEELLFRGIGFPLLLKRFGLGPAVFVISLVFAAMHMHVPSLVPLFAISVGLSLAYVYSGSILVPIVAHAVFNGVNLGLLMMMD